MDRWEFSKCRTYWTRYHVKPRLLLHLPELGKYGPDPNTLCSSRWTYSQQTASPFSPEITKDKWKDHNALSIKDNHWTGKTVFKVKRGLRNVTFTGKTEINTTVHHTPRRYYSGYSGRDTLSDLKSIYNLQASGASDSWKHARTVWERNHVGSKCYDNHLTTPTNVLQNLDFVLLSPECQPFSTLPKGKKTKQKISADLERRKHLYRCITPFRKLDSDKLPKVIIVETLPTAVQTAEFTKLVHRLKKLNYCVDWTALSNDKLNGNSNRDRVFVLAVQSSPESYPHWKTLIKDVNTIPSYDTQAIKVADIINEQVLHERPKTHIRLISDYIASNITQEPFYRGPRFLAKYVPTLDTSDSFQHDEIGDRLYDPTSISPTQRTNQTGWYPVIPPGGKIWSDATYAVKLTSRESATLMHIPNTADIGTDLDDTDTFNVSQRLVGNGIPVNMMEHVLKPVLKFIDNISSTESIDLASDLSVSDLRVYLTQLPHQPKLTDKVRVICDGGSTVSITHNKLMFAPGKLVKLKTPSKISMGKGSTLATHVGIIEFNIPINDKCTKFWTISEIGLYCPDFTVTIASLPTWERHCTASISSRHGRYLVSHTGKDVTSLVVPLVSNSDILKNFRHMTINKESSGLSILEAIPTSKLPTNSIRTDFTTGEPYTQSPLLLSDMFHRANYHVHTTMCDIVPSLTGYSAEESVFSTFNTISSTTVPPAGSTIADSISKLRTVTFDGPVNPADPTTTPPAVCPPEYEGRGLDWDYVESTKRHAEWPPLLSPTNRGFLLRRKKVTSMHKRLGHPSRSMMEILIRMGATLDLHPGDTRYLGRCTDCNFGKGRRPYATHSSKTKSSLRDFQIGECWSVDEHDFCSGKFFGDGNDFQCYYGNHRYSINFVELISGLVWSWYVPTVNAHTFSEAVDHLRNFIAVTKGNSVVLRHLYTDPHTAHVSHLMQRNYQPKHGISMEVTPQGMHWLNSKVERQNSILRDDARTNVRHLIGKKFNGQILHDITMVKKFINLAHHYCVLQQWNRPTAALSRNVGLPVTSAMLYFQTHRPPDFTLSREFGEEGMMFDPDKPGVPPLEVIHLFGSSYCPFVHKSTLRSFEVLNIPKGYVVITPKGSLYSTGCVRWNRDCDGADDDIQDLLKSAEIPNAELPDLSKNTHPDPDGPPVDEPSVDELPEGTSPSPIAGPPRNLPLTGADAFHDEDMLSTHNIRRRQPPFHIRCHPTEMKLGKNAELFRKCRVATTPQQYIQLCGPGGSSHLKNDLNFGLMRFVDPKLQLHWMTTSPQSRDVREVCRTRWLSIVNDELAQLASQGGTPQNLPGFGPDANLPAVPAAPAAVPVVPVVPTPAPTPLVPPTPPPVPPPAAPILPVPTQVVPTVSRRPSRQRTQVRLFTDGGGAPSKWRETNFTQLYSEQSPTHMQTYINYLTLMGEDAIKCTYTKCTGRKFRKKFTYFQNSQMIKCMTASLANKFGIKQSSDSPITSSEDIVHKDILRDFFNGRSHRRELDSRDAEAASFYMDQQWDEDISDEVLHYVDIDRICLHILSPNDLSIVEEEIADLRKIVDPFQRKKATQAVLKELHDLCKLGTFELIRNDEATDTPAGLDRKIIGSKLILKVKYNADGTYLKHKGRLVATGFQQRPGFEFWSTFSPMASLTAVRLMCSEAVKSGWSITHADIPNAFCQSQIDTEILFKFPKGITVKGNDSQHFVRLVKALYGLKQSPALFHRMLIKVLTGMGFVQASTDSCLFYFAGDDECGRLYICAEVDDLVITGENPEKLAEVKEVLTKTFGADNSVSWEPLKSFLGIDIDYDISKGECTFGVPYKIQKLFDEHPIISSGAHSLGMGKNNKITPSDAAEDRQGQNPHVTSTPDEADSFFAQYGHRCKATSTSSNYDETVDHKSDYWSQATCNYTFRTDGAAYKAASNSVPLKQDTELNDYLKNNYRSVVGSMIYIMITCRPDICFSVGKLSRHMHAPELIHVTWLKRALRYLKRTQYDKLRYTKGSFVDDEHQEKHTPIANHFRKVSSQSHKLKVLCGFTDANHANAREAERRSISGFCFFLYGNLITWKSKTQPITAASTHEAELIALSSAADEALWMRNLLTEVGIEIKDPVPIMCDNQGTVFTVHNPYINHRSKHLDIRYFRARQHIRKELIDVFYCPTALNLSDFFTKSLGTEHFHSFRDLIMNTNPDIREEWRVDGDKQRAILLAEKQLAI